MRLQGWAGRDELDMLAPTWQFSDSDDGLDSGLSDLSDEDDCEPGLPYKSSSEEDSLIDVPGPVRHVHPRH